MKYFLLDANVVAGYYLPRSLNSKKARENIRLIFNYVRAKPDEFFLYMPNFCVAEVFSVFMKHSFGTWNQQVKEGTIDTRVYTSLVKQFQKDIHNGRFIKSCQKTHKLACGMKGILSEQGFLGDGESPNHRLSLVQEANDQPDLFG